MAKEVVLHNEKLAQFLAKCQIFNKRNQYVLVLLPDVAYYIVATATGQVSQKFYDYKSAKSQLDEFVKLVEHRQEVI